jgi:hypothetical protein
MEHITIKCPETGQETLGLLSKRAYWCRINLINYQLSKFKIIQRSKE